MITGLIQMARRKANRRATKKFKGINVTDAALGYAGVSIWSEALLGVNPIQFFTKQPASMLSDKLNVYEIIDSLMGGRGGVSTAVGASLTTAGSQPNAFGILEKNARTNGIDAVVKSVGLGIAGSVGKKVTRKPRAYINKTIRQFGMGDFIRF
jgi:hypothetical protein